MENAEKVYKYYEIAASKDSYRVNSDIVAQTLWHNFEQVIIS